MVNVKTLGVAALVAVAVIVLAVRFWPGEERAIRARLAVIEKIGSKAGAEQPLESLSKARQIAGLFNDPSQLVIESVNHVGSYSRQQIQERIVMVRAAYVTATVSLHDLAVGLTGKDTATVHGTIRVRGQGASGPVADVRELRAGMAKIDGQWLMTEVTLVEVLER